MVAATHPSPCPACPSAHSKFGLPHPNFTPDQVGQPALSHAAPLLILIPVVPLPCQRELNVVRVVGTFGRAVGVILGTWGRGHGSQAGKKERGRVDNPLVYHVGTSFIPASRCALHVRCTVYITPSASLPACCPLACPTEAASCNRGFPSFQPQFYEFQLSVCVWVVGCLMGMTSLLFMDLEKAELLKRQVGTINSEVNQPAL